MFDRPHRRLNALNGEWVSVSPHRNQRPWQGRAESASFPKLPTYDPNCYLCPGNVRANAERNPDYRSTYAFTNDFAAFLPDVPTDSPSVDTSRHPLLHAQAQAGTCRVLCFSPRHDLTLAQMSAAQIRPVVDLFAEQVADLGRRWRWVQVFENKGEFVWRQPYLPPHCLIKTVTQPGVLPHSDCYRAGGNGRRLWRRHSVAQRDAN